MILLEGEKDVWLHTETRSHKAIGLYLQAGYCKKKPRWTQRGEPLRLHILGGAGSGKSYVARQISKCFAIPHYDLDDLFWDKTANEYGIKASESERDVALQAIVSQNDWVIEGVYIDWLDPSFRSADKIFVIMTPLTVQEERIWTRYADRKRGIVTSKKETYESVAGLVEWNKKYNAQSLPNFISNSEYKDKIIVLNSNTDVFEYLNSILPS